MSEDRLTASKMFAVEMLRAALGSDELPLAEYLKKQWKQMTFKVVPPIAGREPSMNLLKYRITLSVHGFASEVYAAGFVDREDGEWRIGSCVISIPAIDPLERWSFQGHLENNEITVQFRGTHTADQPLPS